MALLAVLASCAVKPFPEPRIAGQVKSVSRQDIEIVIALAERSMRERIGWAVPTERIEVEDHDHCTVIYRYGGVYVPNVYHTSSRQMGGTGTG
jgi:hypothetical protein